MSVYAFGCLKLWHQNNQLLLQDIDFRLGIGQLVNTLFVFRNDSIDRVSPLLQQFFECLNQDKGR